MKISVEVIHDQVVEINADPEGLDYLIEALTQLKSNGDHVHLMSEDWGMWQLDNKSRHKDGKVIHHLEVIRNEG